ncbi:MAG: HIT domain-containing protein [Candidatus Pacebacteria bacterium]|nr:HIT domain-containing protein [Candidatus Paceibacterota bacterium]MCF7863073.1 HIT domain-containing protein [Candidatus Paceibacterota bacterium]
MQDCIFCKIINGEIPAYKVYEDESTLAFLDINPINKGHVLVIPKKHEPEFQDLEDLQYTSLMSTVKKISLLIKEKIKPKRVGVMVAGWDVPHTHIHVVPMNDTTDITSKRILEGSIQKYTPEEFEETVHLLNK